MLNIRVAQSTQTSGLGTIQLDAPANNRRSFVDAFGTGAAVYYVIESADGVSWEAGFGVITAGSPDTLTRNVIESSNGNALVNFSVGSKRVMCAQNADALRFGAVGDLPQATGTASHLLVSYKPAVRHLRNGMKFSFVAAYDCPGPSDLAIDALTVYPIINILDGSDLRPNQWGAGRVIEVVYFSGNFYLKSIMSSAAGASMILLNRKVASNSPNLTITDIPGGYDHYVLSFNHLRPVSSGGYITMQFSRDNGVNFVGSSYSWMLNCLKANGTTAIFADPAANSLAIAESVSNAAGCGINGTVKLFGLGDSSGYKGGTSDCEYYDGTYFRRSSGGVSLNDNGNAVNSVRVFSAVGNLSDGSITLYGVRAV